MEEKKPVVSVKAVKKRKKKTLLCPICGRGRIIDESEYTESEVRAVSDDDPWPADYYAKCNVCKGTVGVKKLNKE